MKKILLSCALVLMSAASHAEYSDWGTPTLVSLVLDKGFRVEGAFGNPNSCERSDIVFVSSDHPQYDQMYSMVLAAFASGSRLSFEVRKCAVIGWVSSKTIAIIDDSSRGEIRNVK